MYRAPALGAFSVPQGKWKMEINAPESASWFSAGDDVAAMVTAAKNHIRNNGGQVTDESGHFVGSGVDLFFTASRSFNWPYSWGKMEKDQNIVQRFTSPAIADAEAAAERQRSDAIRDAETAAERQRQAAIRDAEAAAERQRLAAQQDAYRFMEDADRRAEARMMQTRDMLMWGGIALITLGAITYIAVSD